MRATFQNFALALVLYLAPVHFIYANDSEPDAPAFMMNLSEQTRVKYFNPDGSCVQLSIGIAGTHCNNPIAAKLPFNSEYGPGIRGGSGPDRVGAYCDQRKIEVWNVTGRRSIDWIIFSAETGRGAAIGLGRRHFQTLYGYDPNTDTFYVCNNQTPKQIDKYTRAEFLRLHHASGEWVVILKNSASDNPVLVDWYAEHRQN